MLRINILRFNFTIKGIYNQEDIEMLKELLNKGIIEKDDIQLFSTNESNLLMDDLVNTEGVEFVKKKAKEKSELEYDQYMSPFNLNIDSEYNCLKKIIDEFNNRSSSSKFNYKIWNDENLTAIEEINNSKLTSLLPSNSEIKLFYSYFIKKNNPLQDNFWDTVPLDYKSIIPKSYVETYSTYLLIKRSRERFKELESNEYSKTPIIYTDLHEIDLKHQYALMYKLGIIEQIKERAEVVLSDVEIARIISQILNITNEKKIDTIRSYQRDVNHINKKDKFWNKNTTKKMEELKAKFGLTYFDE